MHSRDGQLQLMRFFTALVLMMKSVTFVPQDRPPSGRLYLIIAGYARFVDSFQYLDSEEWKAPDEEAEINSQALGPSDSWGAEDIVLKSPLLLCVALLLRSHSV